MSYIKINDKYEAVRHFNEHVKTINNYTKYRVLEYGDDSNIVTNVPLELYENPQLTKYSPPPVELPNNNKNFIKFLQDGFNFFHNNHPDMQELFDDGKMFHHNECYHNSLGVKFSLLNLAENNGLSVTDPICISLGYISKSVVPGGVVGNALVNMEGLTVHDWHIWNKINNFIVDLSVTKSGGIFELGTTVIEWEKAEDHVFKYPPENTTYYGVDFVDSQEFNQSVEALFEQR